MLIPRGLAIALLIVAPATGTLGTLTPASAQDPTTHTVAVDGSADFTSVQAAVDAAASGDVVMVLPGTYTEQVVIDKDLDLMGDGPRAEVVIAAPTDAAGSPEAAGPGSGQPFALWLAGETVTVSDLTVAIPHGVTGVVSTAGAPLIERVSLVGGAEMRASAYVHSPYRSMAFFDMSRPTVRDSEWDGYVTVRDGASVTFVGNTVYGDTISIDGPGETSVRDTVLQRGSIALHRGVVAVIEGNEFNGDITQLGIDSGSSAEVRGNVFNGSVEDASIWIEGSDTTAVISGNTVNDSQTAIRISDADTVTVTGNALEAAVLGIAITGANALIDDNTIASEAAGIGIAAGAEPTITGNTIDAGGNAIVVGFATAPVISGNVVCGEEVSIFVMDGASPEIGGNEVCEDVQAG